MLLIVLLNLKNNNIIRMSELLSLYMIGLPYVMYTK